MARNNQTGLTPAQKKARARARARRRAEARRQRQQARLNPLNAPFKTPAQLRAEAQRMAELSVVPEETLRAEQQKQETGLGALTGTTTSMLGGYQQQVAGGLQGLGQMYQNIAGTASEAGQEALAAAGAATTAAPGAVAAVPAEFANLVASTAGYVPAAAATGQRLIGESRLGLTKALTDRANTLSSNMAKYLDELKQREYEKAVAQEVNRQNIARLGLQEQQIAADVAMDEANLALKRQGLALDAQRLLLDIEKESNRQANRFADKNKKKREKIRSAQEQILASVDELFKPAEYATSKRKYKVNYVIPAPGTEDPLGQPKTGSTEVEATSLEDAQEVFGKQYPGFTFANASALGFVTEFRVPKRSEVLNSTVRTLVKAGMTRKRARRFVLDEVLPLLPSYSGAFLGGVGGG